MTWKLFLDDERFPADNSGEWKIARSHQEVTKLVDEFGFPSYVSFDHDLGAFENGTGYIVAKYLVSLDMHTDYKFPKGFEYYVHSQNPIGKVNIEGYLNNYLRVKDE